MPHLKLKPDNLNQRNAEFSQVPLKQPVFLNSVPKSGSHLLRNIMRMFVPVEQHFKAGFIQFGSLAEDQVAWDMGRPTLSWGHLLYSDNAVIALKDARKVLLVRDPYDWVLARARFFMSENFSGSVSHISGYNVSAEQFLNMMIFGIHQKVPNMKEIYMHNGVSWMHTDTLVLKFEDLSHNVKNLDEPEAEVFFKKLLDACGIDMPDDWLERVRIGSDREQSATARENLVDIRMEFPNELPDGQRQLIDFAVPGLRKVLGYE
jgi:hypothetical protein